MSEQILMALGTGSLLAWIYLAFFRGWFWRTDQRLDEAEDPAIWPKVVALVLARNEEKLIRDSMRSLRDQNYPGEFHIILIDDNSSDDTAQEARESGGPQTMEIIQSGSLEPGWTGKLWALSRGESHLKAGADGPDYLWLTDADIIHDAFVLKRLVAKAKKEQRAMVSLIVKLNCESFWENSLIPAFVFFFQKLYPFSWANNPGRKMAAAAGGCILLERDALKDIGGFASIRSELIDDCSLAQKIKDSGKSIWIGLGDSSRSVRSCGLSDIWAMVTRTAFWQLGNSLPMLLGTLLAMSVVYLAPPVLTIMGASGAFLGALAWLSMFILYAPILIYYRRSILYAPFLPVIALLFMVMTMHSAFNSLRGQGGKWKGRTH